MARAPTSPAAPLGVTDPRRPVAIALLLSLLVWNLPLGALVMYPFKLLATWLHESSHAVLMLLTGAGVERIEIFADGSGLAFPVEGVNAAGAAAIAAAGYMGTPLLGVGLLVAARDGRRARWLLAGLGLALLVSALALVGNGFGQTAMAATGAGLLVVPWLVPAAWARFLALLVAAQSCLNALLDIRVLFRPSLVVDGAVVAASDAHAMARATLGVDDVWAVWSWAALWLGWSLVLLFVAFSLALGPAAPARPGRRSAPAAPAPAR
ncbi:MAG: M50 family metallopeptidase [Kofleriaceae bacterium]|nr:M50 family metallopeptidase [Kofleriaceae bacterium]MBP6839780.1 M50 family metallopeptidase [Kofleriaceae bacterium]MBP9203374.1 M50 family metallopeptidase [Kofleriaceae bacterium]